MGDSVIFEITNTHLSRPRVFRPYIEKKRKSCVNIWNFQNKFVSLHRQNVVRGRERFAFAAEFKLDLSDHHTRTWPTRLCPQFFYHIVDQLLDGLFVRSCKIICFDDDSLAVMNHITFLKIPLAEIFMATEETGNNLLCFQDTLRHVHIEV